jgi:ABC-type multidrug transport system fused ATPase/permease subunit
MGKILQIFTEDMNVFNGGILDPLQGMLEMTNHVIVVFSILFVLGSWEVYFGLGLMFWIMSGFIKPYLHADNQLHKVNASLWDPIHSYFHECMRGSTIIRAYGQEEAILKKQHMLLDKTTIHFIAHHSSSLWFNLRMFYSTKIISLVALAVIAKNRTTVDTVTLVMLFNWTIDMGWFMQLFSCFNHFMRLVVKAQRVFNL